MTRWWHDEKIVNALERKAELAPKFCIEGPISPEVRKELSELNSILSGVEFRNPARHLFKFLKTVEGGGDGLHWSDQGQRFAFTVVENEDFSERLLETYSLLSGVKIDLIHEYMPCKDELADFNRWVSARKDPATLAQYLFFTGDFA